MKLSDEQLNKVLMDNASAIDANVSIVSVNKKDRTITVEIKLTMVSPKISEEGEILEKDSGYQYLRGCRLELPWDNMWMVSPEGAISRSLIFQPLDKEVTEIKVIP